MKSKGRERERERLTELDRIGHALLASIANGKDVFGGEGAVESVTDREGEGEDGVHAEMDEDEAKAG